MAINQHEHDVRYVGSGRGTDGKRTVFFGYCTCGRGTTNSANPASASAKIKKHATGDDSGMAPVRP